MKPVLPRDKRPQRMHDATDRGRIPPRRPRSGVWMAENRAGSDRGTSRARAMLTTVLGRGGLVLGAIVVMVVVLALVLLALTWFSGLSPETPSRY